MEECVIDQLKTCITHVLKAKSGSVLYVTPHIEEIDNALFFNNSSQLDDLMMLFAGKSYIKRGNFNYLDKMFQDYLTETKIEFTVNQDHWTILSFDEAYKLLALLKLEGY